jgi:NifU-like protein involved in Fe-S cluster formation
MAAEKCDWAYSDIVKDHFLSPRNFVRNEKDVKGADGVGIVGSPACGDVMKMWIWVKDGKITDCKWMTFGCASAIASTSMLSVMIKGKNLEDAMKITPKQIADRLGGLPSIKIHCSVLGDQALRAAIADYEKKVRKGGKEK